MIHFFGLNCENKTKGTKVLGNRTTNFALFEHFAFAGKRAFFAFCK